MMAKLQVGKLSEIDPLGARKLQMGETEIALFRLSGGEVRALENRCPHKGGKLSEGMVCGRYVHCPLHDWKIDLDNGQVQAPDKGCVAVYETDVDSGSGIIYIKHT